MSCKQVGYLVVKLCWDTFSWVMVKLLWYWITSQYLPIYVTEHETGYYCNICILPFLMNMKEWASIKDWWTVLPYSRPWQCILQTLKFAYFFWVLISIFTAAGAFKLIKFNNAPYLVIFSPFLWTCLHFHLQLCNLCLAEIKQISWRAVRCVRSLSLIGCFSEYKPVQRKKRKKRLSLWPLSKIKEGLNFNPILADVS